jgi:hypothetical protein
MVKTSSLSTSIINALLSLIPTLIKSVFLYSHKEHANSKNEWLKKTNSLDRVI